MEPELRINIPPEGLPTLLPNGSYAFVFIILITMTESSDTSTTLHKAEIIAKHLREKLEVLRNGSKGSVRPLMVSMQGPQGAGMSS